MTWALGALLLAWGARVVGACFLPLEDGPERVARPRAREVVDAVALPLQLVQAKHQRGDKLSALRGLAWGTFFVLAATPSVNPWAFVIPGGYLLLDTLLAAVPAKELLNALTAILGNQVAKRTRTVTLEEQTEVAPPGFELPPANDGARG